MSTTRANTPAKEQTIREHYAGLAMQAVIAKNPPCGEYHDVSDCDKPSLYARAAVFYADALIAELAKPVKP